MTARQLLVIASACHDFHPSALSKMLPLLLALHRTKRKLMRLAELTFVCCDLLKSIGFCCDCATTTGDCCCMSHINIEQDAAFAVGLASSEAEADEAC